MIHFVTANLDRRVHAQALGFTTTVYLYGWGATPEEAEESVRAYLKGIGVGVTKFCSTTKALQQDISRYTFPEQLCGAPHDAVVSVIRSQHYPEDWINESVAAFFKREQTISQGRLLLAHESAVAA